MLEDLEGLPLIDNHCHAFVPSGPLDLVGLAEVVALASSGRDFASTAADVRRHNEYTIFYRWLLRELAAFLGCEPESVLAARNRASADYGAYTHRLFRDAGLETILVDTGYPQPPVDIASFRRMVGCRAEAIFRLEPMMDELLRRKLPWQEFLRAYEEAIAAAVEREMHVALKSIIAYRTGLDVRPAKEGEARRAFEKMDNLKPLRDFLLCRALEMSIELKVPMQLHTGFGDLDIAFNARNPALLFDLLKVEPYRRAIVVFIHCYPFVDDAAYMAAILPGVYFDLSLTFPYTHQLAAHWLSRALTVAPASKLLYGSDGFALPEIHWLAAKLFRRALREVLEGLVSEGFLREKEAWEFARLLAAENARRIYRIGG